MGSQLPMGTDFLQKVLKKGDDPRPSRAKKSSIDTSVRTVTTWFKLQQRFGHCENPDCTDDRPATVKDGKAMVAEVNLKTMCRLCFLDNYGNVGQPKKS